MKTYVYQCSQCKSKSHRSLPDWAIQCSCGGTMTSSQETLDQRSSMYTPYHCTPSLTSARKEAKAKKGKLWRHVFQCPDCDKCEIVTVCEATSKCSCGGTTVLRYSYDNTGKEYGGESKVQRTPRKPKGKLRLIRDELGLTQEELAESLDCSQQYLSKLENDDSLVTEEIMEQTKELLSSK